MLELNGLHYFSQIFQLDQSFFHERSELRESLGTSSMVCSLGNRVDVSSSRRKQDNWQQLSSINHYYLLPTKQTPPQQNSGYAKGDCQHLLDSLRKRRKALPFYVSSPTPKPPPHLCFLKIQPRLWSSCLTTKQIISLTYNSLSFTSGSWTCQLLSLLFVENIQ